MKIFFSAGEPSGDIHGANLIRALRRAQPSIEAVGYGGPEMAAAGCTLHADLTKLAVMWFARVLANFHWFLSLAGRADRYFRHARPDAVVLIDYPGFNWWIARRAKAHGIPVFYYCPPQLWAWGGWRIAKMRRTVDHVLCALPFETPWYAERGCRSTFVGHPFFDEVREHRLDAAFVDELTRDQRRLVAILPGSRTQEVTQNLPQFLAAASLIHAVVPEVRFAVAAYQPHQAALARQAIAAHGAALPIEVFVRKTPEIVGAAECCLAVSGSVSLELLYHQKPTVILYHISPLAYRVQQFFRRVRYITLVNLLAASDRFRLDPPYDPDGPGAEEVLFPEYLTALDRSRQMAGHAIGWLCDEARRQALVARLGELKAAVGHGGASRQAAGIILAELADRPVPAARPHVSAAEFATIERAAA